MSKVILKNVSKQFTARREKFEALCGINMEFDSGEFVSIVGPSGCGKSTIIRMLMDIIKPTDGEITVGGVCYDNNNPVPKPLIQNMGFVFQNPNLLPWLTLRQNIYLPLKIFGLKGKLWTEYADYLIESAFLTEFIDKYPSSLSQGAKQRAGVIRAMVHKPNILMMDEPYGALDDITRERMNAELLNIWRDIGMTIIFITHNILEAVQLSQRVIVMTSSPGRVADEVKIEWDSQERAIYGTRKFNAYCNRIRRAIGNLDLEKVV